MSTIDTVKKCMGWVHPNARPCCRNCASVEVSGALRYDRPELRCTEGGFFTQAYAICDRHTPMALTGGTPK